MFAISGLLAQAAPPPAEPAPTVTAPPAAEPDASLAERIVDTLGLETTIEQTPWWGWLALLGLIFGGVVIGRIASGTIRAAGSRLERRGAYAGATILRAAATPANLFFIALGLSIGLGFIALDGTAAGLRTRVLNFLYVIAVGWFLFNLVDLVDLWLRSLVSKTSSHLDDQLAPLIRKTLRIFLIVLIGLYTAQNIFNQDVTAWLTGLGIAGLAVSLAAQDSIRNLFGSITILLDKPFIVGERIVFDGFDGPVEEIGFRSTRLRTFDGELITIPNSRFIDNTVRNISRRPNIRRILDISVEYGTTPEQMRTGVEALRRLLLEPGIAEAFDHDKFPPRVYFNELASDHLNIRVIYWFHPASDWWGFMEHAQRVNLRVMEELTRVGVNFAFPTQTLVLTNDGDRPLLVRTSTDDDLARPGPADRGL